MKKIDWAHVIAWCYVHSWAFVFVPILFGLMLLIDAMFFLGGVWVGLIASLLMFSIFCGFILSAWKDFR